MFPGHRLRAKFFREVWFKENYLESSPNKSLGEKTFLVVFLFKV